MTTQSFHFSSYHTATRFQLSHRLMKQGWTPAPLANMATLSDVHLSLNDEMSVLLEYKHLLSYLADAFFKDKMPKSFVIDEDNFAQVLPKLLQHPDAHKAWILKPSMLNNGDDIHVFSSIEKVMGHYQTNKRLGGAHVLQRYVDNPDLWKSSKYTMRIPCVLTNYAGVFMLRHAYFNISALPYEPVREGDARKRHLTNIVLDKVDTFNEQITSYDHPLYPIIFPQAKLIIEQVMKAMVAVFPEYLKKRDVPVFELFGFDFILDSTHKLWLLEVNQGPDFPCESFNALNQILWEPFWKHLIDSFVLSRSMIHPDFVQVITAKEATELSWCQAWKGRRFLKKWGKQIHSQR